MCTKVLWHDPSGPVLVGRNMDYHRDTGTNLWSLPKGLERNDGVGGLSLIHISEPTRPY